MRVRVMPSKRFKRVVPGKGIAAMSDVAGRPTYRIQPANLVRSFGLERKFRKKVG